MHNKRGRAVRNKSIARFLHENLQVRVLYRTSNDTPRRPAGNVNELVAAVHLFF